MIIYSNYIHIENNYTLIYIAKKIYSMCIHFKIMWVFKNYLKLCQFINRIFIFAQ